MSICLKYKKETSANINYTPFKNRIELTIWTTSGLQGSVNVHRGALLLVPR